MEKIQEIELTIKSADDGVFAISLVDQPAIEENFVALAAQDVEFKVVDEERRIVVGFALVPEKRILRLMGGKKFNIYFTKETVAQAAEDFMKKMMLKKFTTDHEEKVDGITVIESWVVEDAKHDKSNLYGLGAKGGEWVLMSKIDNNEVWNEVKAGKFKGYSIEARFDGFEQLQSKNKETMEEQIIKELNAVLSSQKVELNMVTELIKLSDIILSFEKGIVADINRAASQLDSINSKIPKVMDDVKRFNDFFDKVIAQTKELGVDIPPNILVAQRNVKAAQSNLNEIFSSVDKAVDIAIGSLD
jgi:hypothetical protein